MRALQSDAERVAPTSPITRRSRAGGDGDGLRGARGRRARRSGALPAPDQRGGTRGERARAGDPWIPRPRAPRLDLREGQLLRLLGPAPRSSARSTRRVTAGSRCTRRSTWAAGTKLGPDAEYVTTLDYAVDPARADAFYRLGAALLARPARRSRSCRATRAFGRSSSAPGEAWRDFAIDGPAQHGIPGLVQLYGIESPGLTACLALADLVAGM